MRPNDDATRALSELFPAPHPEHLRHLLPPHPHQERIIPSIGIAAENEEPRLGVLQGLDPVGGLGQAVARAGS
jgi:hypothetical protein